MPDSSHKQGSHVSLVERLKSTDKFLVEMRSVLASMDEIDSLRRQRGEAVTDDFGGYKRSSVTKMIAGLEKQRASVLAELAKEEKQRARLSRRSKEEGARGRAEAELPAPSASAAPAAKAEPRAAGEALAAFRGGDAALAIEGMYTALSMDIEKLRDDILQEMRYTYKQDMAIYDDLSALIESAKQTDRGALEESLRPLGEKLDAIVVPFDGEKLADDIAARVLASGARTPAAARAGLSSVERKLEELQGILQGAVSVKQMPEFKRLDACIGEFLRTESYEFVPDILLAATAARDTAVRYIVTGNTLRGETMLSEIRKRLSQVIVGGSVACTVAEDAVASHGLAVTYAPEAMQAFRQACVEFEQSSAIPQDELAERVRRTKFALFGDRDAEAADAETMAEMLAAREEAGEMPDRDQMQNFIALKQDLMSFDLTHFIDLTPPLPEQREGMASADVQAILDAIARLGAGALQQKPAAPAAQQEPSAPVSVQAAPYAAVKKPRTLRPAVSAKDNVVEKPDQPLRIVRNKIGMTQPEDSLSRKVVEDIAVRIANSRVK